MLPPMAFDPTRAVAVEWAEDAKAMGVKQSEAADWAGVAPDFDAVYLEPKWHVIIAINLLHMASIEAKKYHTHFSPPKPISSPYANVPFSPICQAHFPRLESQLESKSRAGVRGRVCRRSAHPSAGGASVHPRPLLGEAAGTARSRRPSEPKASQTAGV